MDTQQSHYHPDAQPASQWDHFAPATLPTAAQQVGLTIDGHDSTVMRYGGTGSAAGANDQAWSWDGINWTQRTSTNSPGAQQNPSLVASVGNNNLLIDSSNAMISWLWDGTDWSMLATTGSFTSRTDSNIMMSDSGIMLFGGRSTSDNTALGDTWLLNNNAWVRSTTTTAPSPRYGASTCAYSPQPLLFGGTDGISTNNETWTFNAGVWTRVRPNNSPPARFDAAIAYSVRSNTTIMFGGTDANGNLLDDTWSWDGTDWSPLNLTAHPTARTGARMVFDQDRNTMVLFGGYGANGDLNDTWGFGPTQ